MRVLNFGSLNIDYVYKVDHILQKGETLTSDSRRIFAGGKGLNQSVAMAKAGLPVFHAGAIGTNGMFLLDMLRKAGVNVDYVKVLEDVPSGHTVIQNDKTGDNCILLFPGANRSITGAQADKTLADFGKGDYLVLQNEINELSYIMEQAHRKGIKIVLNPSPMDSIVQTLPLELVDYFFVNEIEAAQITGAEKEDVDGLIKGLMRCFPTAQVVLTLGSAGSVYIHKEEIVRQNIYKVKAVDTTAAGDTFSGYFLSGIISGHTPAESLDLASRASAIAVTRPGAAPSIPTLEEVKAVIF